LFKKIFPDPQHIISPSRPFHGNRWTEQNRVFEFHVSTITGKFREMSRGSVLRAVRSWCSGTTPSGVCYSGCPFDVTERVGISRIHRFNGEHKNSALSPESRSSRNVLSDL